jgi:K+-sensing histidine kinase KdpD
MKKEIFERSCNPNRRTKGLGLEVTLVRKVMSLNDGKIWVQNKDPKSYVKDSKFSSFIPEVI